MSGTLEGDLAEDMSEEEAEHWSWLSDTSEPGAEVFSAYRQDEEKWRVERLRRTHARARRIFTAAYDKPFPADAIVAMRDHKGEMTVTYKASWWRETLAPVLDLAWAAENEAEVIHLEADQ